MIYQFCKFLIVNGKWRSDMTEKLDVLLLNGRLSKENYEELLQSAEKLQPETEKD